jgi:hypothetical protein
MQRSWVHRAERAEPVAPNPAPLVVADDGQTAPRVHDRQASGPPVLSPHLGLGWAAQVAAMASGLGWELPGPRAAGRRNQM